jgi:hypothetical protein
MLRRLIATLIIASSGLFASAPPSAAQFDGLIKNAVCKGTAEFANMFKLMNAGKISLGQFVSVGMPAYRQCYKSVTIDSLGGDAASWLALLSQDKSLTFSLGHEVKWLDHNNPDHDEAIWDAGPMEVVILRSFFLQHTRSANFPKNIERFIGMGVSPNKVFCFGQTPLYYAILGGSVDATQWLLENGADVNQPFPKYEGSLIASEFKSFQISTQPLTYNPFGSQYAEGSQTTRNDAKAYYFGTEHPVNKCPALDGEGIGTAHLMTPLELALTTNSDEKIINLILDHHPKVPRDLLAHFQISPILLGYTAKQVELRRLVEAGADINAKDKNGHTTLARYMNITTDVLP